MEINRKTSLRNLRSIPGVGPKTAEDLWRLGIRRPSCLKGRNPERLFRRLERLKGQSVDRCVLYVFRCAVYYASRKKPRPELLEWWRWKDRTSPK